VPREHYPNGYDIVARGASVHHKSNSRYLQLENAPKARIVKLKITPPGAR
jgi:hypothetical protein